MMVTIRCARSVGESMPGRLGHCQMDPAPCSLCRQYSVSRAKEEAVSLTPSGTLSAGCNAQTKINRKDWT